MMPEHLTEQEIECYRRSEIDPTARQETEAHLAVCDDCLNRLVNSENGALAFNAITEAFLPPVDEEPFHLSHAEMKSYVVGSAAKADRIICESHVDICGRCSEELRLLSAARTPNEAQAESPSKERLAWRRQGWGSFTPARVVAVFALFALLALALVLWRRQSPRDELAHNGPTPIPVASVAPTSSNEATPTPTTEPDTANKSAVVSPVVLLKDNGKEIRLDEQGELTGLEGFDKSSQKIVKSALVGEPLTKPKVLDDLSSPRITLLGEPSEESPLRLISPLSRVITEDRPTLKWRALSDATDFVVSVFDEKFNRVAQSPPLSKQSWTLAVSLPRGRDYSWEVTAVKDGKQITAPVAPSPRAQFKILEPEKLNTLATLKQQTPVSHLALGLMYARFGLVNEAEGEFRQLVKENPNSAPAKKLLRTVQSWQKQSSHR